MKSRTLIALFLAAAALPAAANTLYKSVDTNGTVTFSDVPPPSGVRVLEERAIPSSPDEASPTGGAPRSNSPNSAGTTNLEQVYGLIDSDQALAEANARVDQAERALAVARNGAASRLEGLRLVSTRNSNADSARIEFYKRDLMLARRALVDLIKERQAASREAGAPRIVASNATGSLIGAVR